MHTPNIDRLAERGFVYTDAHAAAAVCTPSRYGLLTGRYAWRTWLKQGVLDRYGSSVIEPGRLTLQALLRAQGYATMAVGKWHLGIEWPRHDSTCPGWRGLLQKAGFWLPDGLLAAATTDCFRKRAIRDGSQFELDKPFAYGPRDTGFERFYGVPVATRNWSSDLIENERLVRSHVPSARPRETLFAHLQQNSVAELGRLTAGEPFFLYLPLIAPHMPIRPSRKFRGRSELGPYGDYVLELDALVGTVLTLQRQAKRLRNTLIVFTSDNGSHERYSNLDKPGTLAPRTGYSANGRWRGMKGDIYEGGHRVPLVLYWPQGIRPGSSDRTVVLTDLFTTVAELLDAELPDEAAEDSLSLVPDWRRDVVHQSSRPGIVHHAADGMFAIRVGDWKLIEGLGSGGFSQPTRREPEGDEAPVQLYDLATDPGETTNLARDHPDKVAELQVILDQIREQPRSVQTPGASE